MNRINKNDRNILTSAIIGFVLLTFGGCYWPLIYERAAITTIELQVPENSYSEIKDRINIQAVSEGHFVFASEAPLTPGGYHLDVFGDGVWMSASGGFSRGEFGLRFYKVRLPLIEPSDEKAKDFASKYSVAIQRIEGADVKLIEARDRDEKVTEQP